MKWKPAQYRGWESIECRTDGIRLDVVPQLGGRILNYQLGDHQFLWINPLLAGSTPPPTRLDREGGWLNWGGDKVWIAPQGWNDEAHWPGPPDPVLDGGPYRVDWIEDSDGGGIRLTSGTGAASGMQLSRLLQMEEGSSRLRVTATMTNIGGKTPHLSSMGRMDEPSNLYAEWELYRCSLRFTWVEDYWRPMELSKSPWPSTRRENR